MSLPHDNTSRIHRQPQTGAVWEIPYNETNFQRHASTCSTLEICLLLHQRLVIPSCYLVAELLAWRVVHICTQRFLCLLLNTPLFFLLSPSPHSSILL